MKKNYSLFKTRLLGVMLIATIFGLNANAATIEVAYTDTLAVVMADTANWSAGDTIMLTSDTKALDTAYVVNSTINIMKSVVIMGDPALGNNWPTILFNDNGFRVRPGDAKSVTIKNLKFNGEHAKDTKFAGFVLRYDDNTTKDPLTFDKILIEDIEAWNMMGLVDLEQDKNSVYESIVINRVFVHGAAGNEYCIDPNINQVKYLSVTNSTFAYIKGFLKNPDFQGSNDEKGVFMKKNWIIDRNTFYKVGARNGLLQQNDPKDESITLKFTNNIVSEIYDSVRARLIRNDKLAGDFYLYNNVFYKYNSTDTAAKSMADWKYNLDSVLSYPNFDTLNHMEVDPGFVITPGGDTLDFTLPGGSALLTAASDNGPLGDPRWAGGATGDAISIDLVFGRVITGVDVQMTATTAADDIVWSVTAGTGTATIVPNTGLLSPTAAGDVTVTATSANLGENDTYVVTINDSIKVDSIIITTDDDATEITKKGSKLEVKSAFDPIRPDFRAVEWSIDNADVASLTVVSPYFVILKAQECGTVKLTCKALDGSGVSNSVDIAVSNQAQADSIEITSAGDVTEITTKGGTLQMEVDTIYVTENACDDVATETWAVAETENANDATTIIATIDANGLLTATGDSNGVVKVYGAAILNGRVTDTLEITVNIPDETAIYTHAAGNIQVMPNPATDVIRLNAEETAEVVITNLVGATMIVETVEVDGMLDISTLNPGIYIVNITIGNEISAVRLIKK